MKTLIIFLILTFTVLGQDTSLVQDTLMLTYIPDKYTADYVYHYKIEWFAWRDDIEIGLREDGIVVWRKTGGSE